MTGKSLGEMCKGLHVLEPDIFRKSHQYKMSYDICVQIETLIYGMYHHCLVACLATVPMNTVQFLSLDV